MSTYEGGPGAQKPENPHQNDWIILQHLAEDLIPAGHTEVFIDGFTVPVTEDGRVMIGYTAPEHVERFPVDQKLPGRLTITKQNGDVLIFELAGAPGIRFRLPSSPHHEFAPYQPINPQTEFEGFSLRLTEDNEALLEGITASGQIIRIKTDENRTDGKPSAAYIFAHACANAALRAQKKR